MVVVALAVSWFGVVVGDRGVDVGVGVDAVVLVKVDDLLILARDTRELRLVRFALAVVAGSAAVSKP